MPEVLANLQANIGDQFRAGANEARDYAERVIAHKAAVYEKLCEIAALNEEEETRWKWDTVTVPMPSAQGAAEVVLLPAPEGFRYHITHFVSHGHNRDAVLYITSLPEHLNAITTPTPLPRPEPLWVSIPTSDMGDSAKTDLWIPPGQAVSLCFPDPGVEGENIVIPYGIQYAIVAR